MNAGQLDRQVKLLVRTDQQEATYGTKEATWAPFDTVFANIEDVLPVRGDRLAGDLIITVRQAQVIIRWRDDVSQRNRVEIDGNPMRIIAGPAMLGRRAWLKMIVEELSTEGQQP